MKRTTTIGKMYAVTSAAGCTVTTPDGLPICTVEAGTQGYFTAPTSTVEVDDDAALLTATFNRAASALGLLGGGVKSELPAGYLRAEFLERQNVSGHNQCIVLPAWFNPAGDTVRVETMHAGYRSGWLSVEGSYRDLGFGYGYYTNATALYMSGAKWGYKKTTSDIADLRYHTYRIESTPSVHSFFLDDEKYYEGNEDLSALEGFRFSLFEAHNDACVFLGKKKYWNLDVNGKAVARLLPVLDVAGVPCMLNTVDKGTHYPETTVNFIAGFTLQQARKLGAHLPAGGGKLTISLPTGYDMDAGVAESLETARAKGWTLTVQTYETEAAAATFGMRRVWVRRVQDEQGGYVDADGVRWFVDWCVDMVTPDGSTPEEHGYELFRSVEAATEYWGLAVYVDPKAEQLLTTEEQ